MAYNEHKTSIQNNYGFPLTFDATGKLPLISKRIFDTYADAKGYVDDDTTSAIAGLVLTVVNDGDKNGTYYVLQAAGEDKTGGNTPATTGVLVKLGDSASIETEIDNLRKVVGAEKGDTSITSYVTNATYINNEDDVIDALVKLDSVLKAQKIEKANDSVIVTPVTTEGSEKTTIEVKLKSNTATQTNSLVLDGENGLVVDFKPLENVIGIDKDEQTITAHTTDTTYIGSDNTVVDALNTLDSQIKNDKTNILGVDATATSFDLSDTTTLKDKTNVLDAIKELDKLSTQNHIEAADKSVVVTSAATGTTIGVVLKPSVEGGFTNALELDTTNGLFVDLSDTEAEIKKANVTAATWNGVAANIEHEDNGTTITFSDLTGNNAKVSSAYTTVTYPAEFEAKVASYKVAGTDAIDGAFTKVETTISALTQEVLDNEEVTEKAIEKLVEAAGFSGEPISYVIAQTCPTISASTSVRNALEMLDTELNSRQKFGSVDMPLKVENDVLKLKLSETILDTLATEKGLDADPLGTNILKKDATGALYALADLHYDSTTNKLTFENSLGVNEIKLTGVNFIEKAEYHKEDEELVIYYTKPGETSASTVSIDLKDLVEEYDGQSRNTSTSVAVKTDAEIKADHNVSVYFEHDKENQSKVYADLDIFDCGTY